MWSFLKSSHYIIYAIWALWTDCTKSCSNLQEFVTHLKKLLKRIELNLDFEQSAICRMNNTNWSKMFFSFCYFVLHLSLVHWLQWHFRGSRAIDKVQLMDTCHNMLVTIFPLYCSIILYVALQRIIYWQSATDGHVCHNNVATIYSIILWFGIFPHCNISILFLIPIPCKAVKLSIVCIFELKSCTRVKTSQRMVVPIWVIAQLMHIKQLQNVFFHVQDFFDV